MKCVIFLIILLIAVECVYAQNTVDVTANETTTTYSTAESGSSANWLTSLFAVKSRAQYIQDEINADKSSFVKVDPSDEWVTYTCDGSDNVLVGLFGIPNLISMETLLVITVIVIFFGALRFFGVFGR